MMNDPKDTNKKDYTASFESLDPQDKALVFAIKQIPDKDVPTHLADRIMLRIRQQETSGCAPKVVSLSKYYMPFAAAILLVLLAVPALLMRPFQTAHQQDAHPVLTQSVKGFQDLTQGNAVQSQVGGHQNNPDKKPNSRLFNAVPEDKRSTRVQPVGSSASSVDQEKVNHFFTQWDEELLASVEENKRVETWDPLDDSHSGNTVSDPTGEWDTTISDPLSTLVGF